MAATGLRGEFTGSTILPSDPPPHFLCIGNIRFSLSRHVKQPQSKHWHVRWGRPSIIRSRITLVTLLSPVNRLVRWWVQARGHEMCHERCLAP